MSERQLDWRTPVIAIDFDGVICTDEHPEIGKPNMEIIQEARTLREKGTCLILWTCRTGKELEAAVEACRNWGLEFDAVNENPKFRIDLYGGSDPRKIGADEYWDDKAVYVGTGKQGQWRNIRGISTNRTPIEAGLKKTRQFINEALVPQIELLEKDPKTNDGEWWGILATLRECHETLELFMAELSEPPSIHSWFREGYKAATENAANWFTGFLQETGIIKEDSDAKN